MSFDLDDEDDNPPEGFTPSMPYDEDEDEDGGWAINKDHSDSLWDDSNTNEELEDDRTDDDEAAR
jgi:hypothetical protein